MENLETKTLVNAHRCIYCGENLSEDFYMSPTGSRYCSKTCFHYFTED